MPGLVPGIHVFEFVTKEKGGDGRDKRGHDETNNRRKART